MIFPIGMNDELSTDLCANDLNDYSQLKEINSSGIVCMVNVSVGFFSTPSFYTNCTCDQLPVYKGTMCSAQGYQKFDPAYGKPFYPDYPTSSPYVTSVGATMFHRSSTRDPLTEIVASSASGALITSGGGFSDFSAQPSYQSAMVSQYLQDNGAHLPPRSWFNSQGRAYPDIAMNGHNYMVLYEGGVSVGFFIYCALVLTLFVSMVGILLFSRCQLGNVRRYLLLCASNCSNDNSCE
jgi:hypothetical protein